jgi:hypothetical protein
VAELVDATEGSLATPSYVYKLTIWPIRLTARTITFRVIDRCSIHLWATMTTYIVKIE